MAKNAISIIRGDSRVIQVNVVDSSGNAVDITGGEVFFTVNASNSPTDDTAAVIEKSTSSFTNPTAGEALITLTNTDTQNITPGVYYSDVQYKDASGDITSMAQAQLTVNADIARRIS